jgi:hypothetical protein
VGPWQKVQKPLALAKVKEVQCGWLRQNTAASATELTWMQLISMEVTTPPINDASYIEPQCRGA